MRRFLQTKRLTFREWSIDDLGLAVKLWADPEVTRLIGGPFSQDQIQQRLEQEIATLASCGVQYWPIFTVENALFVGCCGLRPHGSSTSPYELGFHLCRDQWGKGYATEAARAVIDYARDTLRADGLFAGHHPANASSARVLKCLGFEYTHDEFYAATGAEHLSYRLALK